MTLEAFSRDLHADALAAALGTQYELVRLLGRGGMGAVYLAREPFLDRDVAVKVLPSDLAAGDARERFLREARTAAKLSHPNVVPLYTFGQTGAVLYYVMGFVDGESLETRLKREGRLPFDEARRIVKELADALHYAHGLGIVHRDVKPDNVLLDRHTGRAMLTDFGIAKQRATQETLTQTGVIVGTPHYMSPEQAGGEREIDGRSDIYSLGVIAYRMVTGRLPFEGSAMRDVLAQHATRAPVPPSQMVSSLPVDIDTVITRALAKDPAERWPTARAVHDALSLDSEESVPDELRTISEMGVGLLFVSVVLGELAFFGAIYDFLNAAQVMAVAGTAIGVQIVGPLALIKTVRRFGLRTALHEWFRQPTWWKTWWPRFGRRPGDIWDRLPDAVRRFRQLNVTMLPASIVLLNSILFVERPDWLGAHPWFLMRGHMIWPIAAFSIVLFTVLIDLNVRAWGFRKTTGLSRNDFFRMITESTFSRAFWNRPHIAALLKAPSDSGRDAGVVVASPRDLLADIERLARDGESSPHADLYKEAAQAARALSVVIAQSDTELAQLARDLDPMERARIQASLDALGPASANERASTRQMRELLEEQLRLFRDLDARRRDAQARRDRLAEQLRTLALHLAHLRAQSATDSAMAAEITGRVRAVVRGIDYRIEGVKETRALLS